MRTKCRAKKKKKTTARGRQPEGTRISNIGAITSCFSSSASARRSTQQQLPVFKRLQTRRPPLLADFLPAFVAAFVSLFCGPLCLSFVALCASLLWPFVPLFCGPLCLSFVALCASPLWPFVPLPCGPLCLSLVALCASPFVALCVSPCGSPRMQRPSEQKRCSFLKGGGEARGNRVVYATSCSSSKSFFSRCAQMVRLK